MSLVATAALLAVQSAQPVSAVPSPEAFGLSCSLVGREGRRARFSMAAAGRGERRRFAIRAEGESPWIGTVTATRAGRGQDYHFVSGGTPYRLVLEFDPRTTSSTAQVLLEEDRGFPALNVRRAQGSCRASAEAGQGDMPSLPEAPVVRGEAPPHRPISMTEGRVPSDCTIVLRDLSELAFGLEATFDAAGIQFAVTPAAGQQWPASAFTLRGAMLAAIARPPGGLPGGVMTVFGSAGGGAAAGPAQIGYFLRAEPNLIESWIELRSSAGDRPIAGAGHCAVRQGGSA